MISKRIKELRKLKKMSQQTFGEKLGVSRDVIGNIEYDRVEPTELIIKAICSEFNVDYLWLKKGQGEMFIEPDDDLLGRISDLFLDKNDPAITLFKAFAAFDKEDWLVVQKIIDQIKKEP